MTIGKISRIYNKDGDTCLPITSANAVYMNDGVKTIGKELTDAIGNKDSLKDRFDEIDKNGISMKEKIDTIYEEIINARNKQGEEKYKLLGERIDGVDKEIYNNIDEHKKIITFNTFPSDSTLKDLPLNTTFEVKGFYAESDMPKCLYLKTGWASNSINKGTYYIKPISRGDKFIHLPTLGIRTGIEHASANSKILSEITLEFGSLLYLPTGQYYFDRPINLKSKQCSLLGDSMSFTPDTNTKGLTWINFPNLVEGESGIIMGTGSISNVVISGSINTYKYSIDRSKTYIDKDNIEKETYTAKCYGISGGSITSMTNVQVSNFYYGCKLDTGNIYITNFYARSCHVGLSIGNDTKCKGVYGWNIHTLLEIRGSISSAVQVRSDSCHHLVHLNGYMSGVHLTDLDGDYCLGSVVKMGQKGVWCSISNLIINGVVGRHGCYNAYNRTTDSVPTSADIPKDDDVSEWAFISCESNCNLDGAVITTTTTAAANPHDADSELRTPPILFASGTSNSIVTFNTTFLNNYGSNGNITITREKLLDRFHTFSQNENSTRIRLDMPSGTYYIRKVNPFDTYVTKESVETVN